MKVFLLPVLFPLRAFAQDFPTKPIRLIVPFGPGGVADITARSVAPEISRALGQPLVIENKPSAGGVVAGQEAARAAPDGYTLLLINNGTAISRALFRALPYEPEKDFAMISTVGFFPLVIVADPKSPLKTVKDIIAAARAKPGRMNVATIGDRKSTRLNSSHSQISYAVFCLKKKRKDQAESLRSEPLHSSDR